MNGSERSQFLGDAFDDFHRRHVAGESVSLSDYCAQYPSSIRSALREWISAELCLGDNPWMINAPGDSDWPKVGEPFLGFLLECALGRGAFSRVFLAQDQRHPGNRRVVVKISAQGMHEAVTLGELQHPNVVHVNEVRRSESGLSAVSMPYFGCTTLQDVLFCMRGSQAPPTDASFLLQVIQSREQSLGANRAADDRQAFSGTYVDAIRYLAIELSSTLAYLHSQDVMHRDLKPANVLLTRQGKPMLLDFNLAQTKLSTPLRFGGTLPYLAPEQLSALRHELSQGSLDVLERIDHRADLFALGVLLYELLTGRHPFFDPQTTADEDEQVALLLARQLQGPADVRRLNPRVDESFSALLSRCLSFDPALRPSTGADVARALQPEPATLPRRRWLAWTFLPLLVVLVALGAYLLLRDSHDTTVSREQQGDDALAADHAAEAEEHFRLVIPRDNEHAALIFLKIGRAQQLQGKHKEATRSFEQVKMGEHRGVAAACCTYSALRSRQTAVALKAGADAVRLARSAATCNNYGLALHYANKRQEALHWLAEATRLNDGLQAAYLNRGEIVLAMLVEGKGKELLVDGLRDFERAVQLGPLDNLGLKLATLYQSEVDERHPQINGAPVSPLPLRSRQLVAAANRKHKPGAKPIPRQVDPYPQGLFFER